MSIEGARAVPKKVVWPLNLIALLAVGLALSLMGSDSRTLLVTGASFLIAIIACAWSLQRRRHILGWLIAAVTLYFAVFFVRFLLALTPNAAYWAQVAFLVFLFATIRVAWRGARPTQKKTEQTLVR